MENTLRRMSHWLVYRLINVFKLYINNIFFILEIKENIVECLEELDLTELQCLLEGTNLETTLQGDGMFTLFAPTNDVLQDSGLEDLGRETTEFVLGSHVVEKKLESLLFCDGQRLESINEDCFIHVTEIDTYKYVWHYYYRYHKEHEGDVS